LVEPSGTAPSGIREAPAPMLRPPQVRFLMTALTAVCICPPVPPGEGGAHSRNAPPTRAVEGGGGGLLGLGGRPGRARRGVWWVVGVVLTLAVGVVGAGLAAVVGAGVVALEGAVVEGVVVRVVVGVVVLVVGGVVVLVVVVVVLVVVEVVVLVVVEVVVLVVV